MWTFIKFFLSLYRKIKLNFFGHTCRFFPSCSYYFEEAVERFGFVYGSFLALKRLVRCNQWFRGGIDPVPVDNSIFRVKMAKIDVSRETF